MSTREARRHDSTGETFRTRTIPAFLRHHFPPQRGRIAVVSMLLGHRPVELLAAPRIVLL
jgi:hypothetical protein